MAAKFTWLAVGEESAFLPLLVTLALLIVAAKLMGHLAARIGQPPVLGELVAGLLLGPTFLNVLEIPLLASTSADLGEVVRLLGQLGVIWLMFAAGMETELEDLRRSGRPAMLGGIFGVVAPLALGLAAALAFQYPPVDAFFVGITLSATSVSISAQTLLDLGRLRSKEGFALLGAAVIDDILVIVILSLFTALFAGNGDPLGLLLQVLRMGGVIAVVAALALYGLPRLADWSLRLRASEGLLAMVLASVMGLAWVAEHFGGVAAITGAFIGGVGLARSHLREEIEHGLHRLAYAFFVPLFLVDIGLQSNVRDLQTGDLAFALVLIAVAVVSKLAGSGLGALLGGFNRGEAFRMGLGMISRGEVGLIVAGVGVAEGLLPPQLFTMVVLMVVATTLVTPPLLRWAYARQEAGHAAND